MRLNPLSLMGGAYADNSLTWSAQRTLNWLPETAEVEGTRTPIKFADPPGLRRVVDLGTGAPIRGIENVEGTLFVVSGTSLFEIGLDYTATNRGNIPGVGRVSMAHNKQGGTTAANQLAIANGLSGYVYNTSTNVLSQITDESFEGASTVDYIDGFITFTDPQGRFWGHSALNQAGEYSTIDRYDAESAPDPIVSHIASHREAIVFGTRTTEFFRNTGAATNTFQRVDGTELEVGICSAFARARVDNSVCWVSDSLEVFRLEGHSPQRISTRPIEQLLHTVNPANIFAFSWEDRGHKVFYITAPEAFTIGFDFASGMWHERQTFDLPRWRVNALASWNNQWIAGDYTNGLLYVLDWDTHHENGLELIRERASGYTHGGQNKVLAPYVELLFDTGTEGPDPLTISGDLPNAMIGFQITPYSYIAEGGIQPYTFSIQSGALPPGLTLSSAGVVTGTPTTSGSFSWTVAVEDAEGQVATVADSASVSDLFWYASIQAGNYAYARSPDGQNWTEATRSGGTVGTNTSAVGFALDRLYVAAASSAVATLDEVTFTPVTGMASSTNPIGVVEVAGRAVIISGAQTDRSRHSTDGIAFSPVTFTVIRSLNSFGLKAGVLVMGSTNGFVQRCVDGIAFIDQNVFGATSSQVRVCAGRDFFYAHCDNGTAKRSVDGLTWVNTTTPYGAPARGFFYGVTSVGAEVLVGFSSTDFHYSMNNGDTWTLGGSQGGQCGHSAEGVFVIAGGTFFTSTSGTSFAPVADSHAGAALNIVTGFL